MAVNRKHFNEFVEKDNIPEWICPICSFGHIRLATEKSIKETELKKSKKRRDDDEYWSPEEYEGKFTAILTCSNKICAESIYVLGDSFVGQDVDGNGDMGYFNYLRPKLFNPTINLFEILKEYPDDVKNTLQDSFRLFWVDIESCANKIRVIVELIMNERRIVKTQKVKKGKRKLWLNERITKFGEKYTELSANMHAVKWIGNEGSHANASLKSSDLLDGFDLLENCLYRLYSKENERLKKLSDRINKKKGPLSKKKKKFRITTKGIT